MNWNNLIENIKTSKDIIIDKNTEVQIVTYSTYKLSDSSKPITHIEMKIVNYSDDLLERMNQFLKVVEYLNKDKEISNIHLSIDGHLDRCLFGGKNEWLYLKGYITFEI